MQSVGCTLIMMRIAFTYILIITHVRSPTITSIFFELWFHGCFNIIVFCDQAIVHGLYVIY